MARFADHAVDFDGPFDRFGSDGISFRAPDGLGLEILADELAPANGWDGGPVQADHSIRGFHSATLSVRELDFLQRLFVDEFGWSLVDSEGDRARLESTSVADPGHRIDLVVDRERTMSRSGKGTIHHIAFRARDEAHQLECRERMLSLGLRVTGVLDRNYFRSIYFREPGGILFEIATDDPGFSVDEPVEELGSSLKLPEWLESKRESIEARLVELA